MRVNQSFFTYMEVLRISKWETIPHLVTYMEVLRISKWETIPHLVI